MRNYEAEGYLICEGYIQSKQGKPLRGALSKNGYRTVSLQYQGRQHSEYVHRLVATKFVPNPHGYTEVNHKDKNKDNNHPENLEWVSRSYNVMHGWRGSDDECARILSILKDCVTKGITTRAAAKLAGISSSSAATWMRRIKDGEGS